MQSLRRETNARAHNISTVNQHLNNAQSRRVLKLCIIQVSLSSARKPMAFSAAAGEQNPAIEESNPARRAPG